MSEVIVRGTKYSMSAISVLTQSLQLESSTYPLPQILIDNDNSLQEQVMSIKDQSV